MTKLTDDDLELLEELGVARTPKRPAKRTPREERVIAGFEEVERFVDNHGRLPGHGEAADIFEKLYATRLARLRELEECRALLEPMDSLGLLSLETESQGPIAEEMDDDTLLAELGIEPDAGDLTELRHVRSSDTKRTAEEIANRQRCENFEAFKSLFERVQKELNSGLRIVGPFKDNARIDEGDLFVLSGQKALVAEVGDEFLAPYGRKDRRLRVVFDNGTESSLLKRSLERALQKDASGRRISGLSSGPLFSGEVAEGDEASGTIYVLRSKSKNPTIASCEGVVHKIGVTSGKVERRIASAKDDPTFLMADVEVMATYELYNINRSKLEGVLHRVFAPGRLEIEIKDRFGKIVRPREWFVVPLHVIDEVVDRIRNGTIPDYVYDPEAGGLVRSAS